MAQEFEVIYNIDSKNLPQPLLYGFSRITRELIYSICKSVHDQQKNSITCFFRKDIDKAYYEVISEIVEKAAPVELP